MGKEFRKMERLTGEYTRWNCACRHRLFFDVYEIADRLAIIEDILGDDYDLDRLRELVQAGRKGRCVVLPCMIGDTVYVLNHHLGRVFENEVAGFSVGYQSDNRNSVSTVYVGKYGSKTFRRWKFQQFGKTVFLTREEAEAALKEAEE